MRTQTMTQAVLLSMRTQTMTQAVLLSMRTHFLVHSHHLPGSPPAPVPGPRPCQATFTAAVTS